MYSPDVQKKTEDADQIWAEYLKTRSQKLREKLVMTHLPLVKYVVGRMFSHVPDHVSRDDLLNTGVLGLIKAVEKFDPSRNIKFATFAVPRIRGAVIDELRSYDFLPRSVRGRMRELQNAIRSLESELERQPTEEEIAAKMGLEIENYRSLLKDMSPVCFFSLSEPVYDQGERSLRVETLQIPNQQESPLGATEKNEMRGVLVKAMQQLPKNERLMVALYYYEEMTMKEIAVVLKVTESRISQIHTQAMLRLRTAMENAMN